MSNQRFQWVPINCNTSERETKDYWDKKLKKYMREITIIQKCELKKQPIKEGLEGKRLTYNKLITIIQEELDVFIRDNKKKLTDRERKDKYFPGYDEMKRLSKGIYEESDEDLDEACADNKIGNRMHSKSGEFVGYDDNWSWSLEKQGCGQAKMKPGSKKQYFTSVKCGRAAREKGDNVRCWDGKKMEEGEKGEGPDVESKSHVKIKIKKN